MLYHLEVDRNKKKCIYEKCILTLQYHLESNLNKINILIVNIHT
jgi:hypothetical protein